MTYKGYFSVGIAILLLSFTTIQTTFDTSDRSSVILPPTLSSPIDGATNVALSPTFRFSETLNDATIEIYEGNDFEPGRDTLRLEDYQHVKTIQLDSTLDLSGITYANNRLYMITNRTRTNSIRREIIVSTTEGNVSKRISLAAWDDTEDIVYLGGNEFAIAEEKEGMIYRVNILANTVSLDKDMDSAISLSGTFPDNEDDGIEGVSYNPIEDRFYAVDENRLQVHRFDSSGSDSGNTLFKDLSGSSSPFQFDDLSAIYHLGLSPAFRNLDVGDHFFLLSDESHKLVETDSDCNDYGSMIDLPTPSQFEGVTIDDNGRLYIVGEPNVLRIYENNSCNLSKIPTGRLVHEDNAVDGTSYDLPIELNHNTEYTWRIITDEGCTEFSSFRTIMPPVCNINAAQPNIDCDDNCTPNNLFDDEFTITVSATVEGGSGFYTVNDGTKTSQLIASGDSIELGPYFTDITTDIELTFADSVNPDCDTTVMVLRLPCSKSLEETVTSSISSGNDDAYEANDGTMNLNRTIQLGEQINAGGFIFRNMSIPQGATILNAKIQFTARATSTELTTLMISADNNSSSRDFANFNNDITNRPMVSQRVQWEVAPWNTGDRAMAQQTPNISAILQEVVNRRTFGENSNIGIIISGTGNRVIQTRENGVEQAATLTVTYSTSTCPPVGTPCVDSDLKTNKRMQNGECCCVDCPLPGTACNDRNPNTVNDMYDENCVCMGVDSIPAIDISFSIDSSEDDVEENGKTGRIDARNDKITMVRYSGRGNQSIGLRFTNVSIPRGSTISMAELEFVAENNNNRDGILMIYAEDVNNSIPFDRSDRRNVSSRTKTSGIEWDNNPNWMGMDGEKHRTNNIASVIQELINRDDWVGDNVAITIIIEGTGRRVAKSFDDLSGNAPELHIKYTMPIDAGIDTQGTNDDMRR